jgi:2-polyprenyl-3-methyl-5-hydroxy-6-metoxy-1,4-benzoquinol methylase
VNDDVNQAVRRCYSTWGSRYYENYYTGDDAYPPVHTQIVRELLHKHRATSVLDAGCGPASMLRDLDLAGLARYGFDLTPEMLNEGQRVLSAQNVPAENLWLGTVLDKSSFRSGPATAPKLYDAAICFGVLPHIPADSDGAVFRNLVAAVRPGGLVACEARNELFSLFTLNRYTKSFFRSRLIDEHKLSLFANEMTEKVDVASILGKLDERFRLDLPPTRKGYEGEPGYDEVLSRTHNPFELKAIASEAGLRDVDVLFYHYHAFPPMLERLAPQLFRVASVDMENPHDWRGYFMASAFIIKGFRD